MYYLVRKSKKYKLLSEKEFFGLTITLKNNKLCIIKDDLKDFIIKAKHLKSFENLVKNILIFLETEDDSDGASFLLDELAREYAVFKNKYLKELSVKAREDYIRKVRLLALELKKYIKTKDLTLVKVKTR